MNRLLVCVPIAILCVAIAGDAATITTTTTTIHLVRTDPTSGKQMFTSYCAPCHGIDGRGQGPEASALKVQPSDLTSLAKRHSGRFPDNHIYAVLCFGTNAGQHGSEMPNWGPILKSMSRTNPQSEELRISNLSRYIQTLQVR